MEGHQAALHSAILNTLINARHAIKSRGEISVKTTNLLVTQDMLVELALKVGEYVQLEIRDTGVGIPEELRDKIFQPYFTTRAEGTGTGLGLAALRATIVEHEGHVSFYSIEGVGTTFHVLLPVHKQEVLDSKPSYNNLGGWNVLVIDDEERVRILVRELLQTLGCQCTTASEGYTAVQLFGEQTQRFDVVLLDMQMPGLNGAETFARLSAFDQCCPVIIMSGFLTADSEHKLRDAGIASFLPKPFSRLELQQAIAMAIDCQNTR